MRKVGKQSIVFDNVYLKSSSAVVGPLEMQGPLAKYFDAHYDNLYCKKQNWEQAEMQLFTDALDIALVKGNLTPDEIDLIFAGDLNNQITVANYSLRDYSIPYVGVYGACSTSTLSLINGACLLDGGFGRYIMCATSSHNATSERQFRYPTEYGGQKPDSITFTVTGAGAGILTRQITDVRLTKATVGTVVDSGTTDSLDMGRSMAPAALQTLKAHLEDFQEDLNSFDLILTGDLSTYGAKTLKELAREFKIELGNNYHDCGMLVYDLDNQPVFAGGSGCACAAVVMYGYVVKQMLAGRLNKVLIIATGALLNPIMVAQKETIPGIAHAVVLERVK
ncbi:MAG TPA: stage V sporulation protein AD [Bacilli bacterium]|nr:stage V sporulation protein AD [Bacilli bacterium]